MQEGLRLWRELGDPHSISLGLNFLVETQIALERYEEAIAWMQESIALCERTKNRWGMGTAYRYLGAATLAAGNYIESQEYLQKSLEIFGEYFTGWDIARTLIYLARAYILSGESSAARPVLLDALQSARDVHSSPLLLEILTELASLEKRHHPGRAADWLLVVRDHPAATQETKERACKLLAEVEGHAHASSPSASLEVLVDRLILNSF